MKISINEVGPLIGKLALILTEHPGSADELLAMIHELSGSRGDSVPNPPSVVPQRIAGPILEEKEIEVGKTMGKEAVINLYRARTGMSDQQARKFVTKEFELIGWIFDEDLAKRGPAPSPPGFPPQAPIMESAPSEELGYPQKKKIYPG